MAHRSKLTFVREDNDNCRVYYADESNRLFCWQQDHRTFFVFYACTDDGEPSHPVKTASTTPPPPGRTSTGRDLIAFLRSP